MLPRPGRFRSWLLAALSILVPAVWADEFAIRVWETDDGLAHNGVNSVIQAKDGFLWLATQNGIMRFDGHALQKWYSPLLSDERTSSIRSLIEQGPETLLMAHDNNGLLRLQRGVMSVHPLSGRIPAGQRITKLLRESETVFWIAFSNRELWRCVGDRVEVFPAPPRFESFAPFSLGRDDRGNVFLTRGAGVEHYSNRGLARVDGLDDATAIVGSAHGGFVWVATSAGLRKLDSKSLLNESVVVDWPTDLVPLHLFEDSNGALWIGTRSNGVLEFKEGRIVGVPASYPRINETIEDREGNIWVASAGGGLNRIQPARFTLFSEDASVLPDIVGSVCEDAFGDFWFGNRNCFGQLQQGRLVLPPRIESVVKKAVPLSPDRDGHVWFAAASRLGRFKSRGTEPPEWFDIPSIGSIHALYAARDGSLWVAGENGPLLRIREKEVKQYGPTAGFTAIGAQAIAESPSGDLWFGTAAGELFRFASGKFERFGSEAGLPMSAVRAIYVDADEHVWIGTGGRGVFVLLQGKFRQITEQNGLPDDTISQIIEDDLGVLWFGSSRALFKAPRRELLDVATGRVSRVLPVVFGKADGLAGFSAAANYQPSTWKSKDGGLWFATRKGLVTTRPDRQAPALISPTVFIDAVGGDGRAVERSEKINRLEARKVEFRYTTPTFASPEKVRFRHRLEGLDTDWTELSDQRAVTYSQLPPGKYALRVIATNHDLLWTSDEATLNFEVMPDWWQTWWARATGGLLGALLLAAGVRFWSQRRLRAQVAELEARRRLETERSRIARDLHDSLGASLTQAGMLADEICEDCHTADEMREYSAELASRVRLIARDLDAAVWAVSPKNDTLASLSAYLSQFALEFFRHTSTRCRVQIADDIPPVPLSPEVRHHLFLTAREAMNNVLKHARADEVRLSASTSGGLFELRITDDGDGFDPQVSREAGRNGLRNMETRIREIGGVFEMTTSGEGTMIRITLAIPAEISRTAIETLAH